MRLRRAVAGDIPDIVRSIWISEHTGNELYTYPSLFDLTDSDYYEKFSAMLSTDTFGHSLTWKDFWIGEVDGKTAGIFSYFLEGSNGDSSHMMTGLLMEYFTRAQVMQAFQKLAGYKSIQIHKTKGAYQLDSVSVFPEFRGQGIFGKMLSAVMEEVSPGNKPDTEIQVWLGNDAAIRAYTKEGFTLKASKEFDSSGKGRILLTNF